MNPHRRAWGELLEWASCAEADLVKLLCPELALTGESELDMALSALQDLRRRATSELETCDA